MPDASITSKTTLYLVALVLSGLSACARPTQVESTWHEPVRSSRLFDTVLVIGISENARQRRRFENTMAMKFENVGVTALPSHLSMDADLDLNRDTVAKVVKSTDATAVMVTRLVSHDVTSEEIKGRTEIKTRRRSDTPLDFFSYDYDEYEEQAYLVVKSTVHLKTDVFQTMDDKLIYTIETTTYDKETEFAVLDEVTTAIIRAMQKDGLFE